MDFPCCQKGASWPRGFLVIGDLLNNSQGWLDKLSVSTSRVAFPQLPNGVLRGGCPEGAPEAVATTTPRRL